MNPDLLLGVVAALSGFVLKTTIAFGVCLALSWLAGSPSRRFLIWLSFLYGAAAYWLWLAERVVADGQSCARMPHGLVQPAAATIGLLQIPSSWAFPLGAALQVSGIAYLLVVSYLLATHLNKHRQIKRILGFASQPPGEITAAFQPLADKLRVGRSKLLVLSGATSPATFGWIRPTILLPDVCLGQDNSELEDILRHELHHIRRCDFVWNGFAVVSRVLLFFHPAAWYAVRKMQFDRELACDMAVVSDSPTRRANYANCLIRFARLNASRDPAWGIDFAAPSAHLKARVHSILAESKKSAGWSVWLRAAGGLVLLAGFFVIEPSLGVLFSYAQQRIARPAMSEISATQSKPETRARSTRRQRLSNNSVQASPDAAVVGTSQTESDRPADPSAEDKTADFSSTKSGVGPQLLHRRSPALGSSSGAKQQTVLIADPSSQVNKGDHDGKQALQQSATVAAAIYKRLSVFDRH